MLEWQEVAPGNVLHLGVDARDMFAPNPRGVGKALRTLFKYLLPLMPGWKVNFYTNRQSEASYGYDSQVRWIDMRGDRFNTWENIRLPLASFTDRIGILHCPSQTAPPVTACPVVLTVHDLIPLRIDDGWSPAEVSRFRKTLGRSIAKARRIITVSEFTKQDLLAEFRVPKEKVDVVWWGVESPPDGLSATDAAWDSLRDLHGIRFPFFIAFGGEAPRKNVPRILEAFSGFTGAATDEFQLVLLGVTPLAKRRFHPIIDRLGISKRVVLLEYLDDMVVSQLMKRAEALIYTSLYEGFGLHIIEAMSVGTPVVTSNVTSLPEIAADAALLVDPNDAGAIADAMMDCFAKTELRVELKDRGLRRVKDFSWENVARQTLEVYQNAL